MADDFIERRIVTGLIVSTEFAQQVYEIWDPRLLDSATAKTLASWCVEYFEQYRQAPGRDIEGIYAARLKDGLPQDKAEDIEEILEGLSEEYERESFNVQYLLDQTKRHFREQHLKQWAEDVKGELEGGSVEEAERLASGYTPLSSDIQSCIDPFDSATRFRAAFEDQAQPLVKFPKALGRFWNGQFTRDAFVALLGPEKRGKTFWLMEIALRAVSSGCNVIFFQAGDMSEAQQLRRLGIYLAKKSDKEKHCQGLYVPVVDCVYNQTDECDRDERESDFGPFDGLSEKQVYDEVTAKQIITNFNDLKDYAPCRNCQKMRGAPWVKWQEPYQPLDWKTAYKKAKQFRKKHGNRFKLATYPNETLTVGEIRSVIDNLERREGFVPDVVLIDYADIMASDPDLRKLDYRQQVGKSWQRMRRLSSEMHNLVVTATQSDADSYNAKVLKRKHFSEAKSKHAHVTAMYGLNQMDEEKKKGMMRINSLDVREDEFTVEDQVTVLQCLPMGRPYIGSFF